MFGDKLVKGMQTLIEELSADPDLGKVLGFVRCPVCMGKWMMINLTHRYCQCRQCGHRWRLEVVERQPAPSATEEGEDAG